MPFRRLGAGHDLTCERGYSGYEIGSFLKKKEEPGNEVALFSSISEIGMEPG